MGQRLAGHMARIPSSLALEDLDMRIHVRWSLLMFSSGTAVRSTSRFVLMCVAVMPTQDLEEILPHLVDEGKCVKMRTVV